MLSFPLHTSPQARWPGGQFLPCPFVLPHPHFSVSSQFLCLKNIRTFLSTCCEKFGLKRSELFEAFDLFDVQDFGKVSCAVEAQRLSFSSFLLMSTLGKLRTVRGQADKTDQAIYKMQIALAWDMWNWV